MENKYLELKYNYNEILMLLDGVNEDEIQTFLISLSLCIWSANEYYADEYGKALLAITGENYSTEQIYTAMCCCEDKINQLEIPNFIKNASNKKELINEIGEFLGAIALINGDFTMHEANIWNQLMNQLKGNTMMFRLSNFNPNHHITELNEEGYYHSITNEKNETVNENEDVTQSINQIVDEVNKAIDDVNEVIKEIKNSNSGVQEVNHNKENEINIKKEDFSKKENLDNNQTLEELMQELNDLVGLDTIKDDVISLLNFIKIANLRKSKGLKVPEISYHLVFTGNPGTGKTTIARLIAKLYYKMGLLSKGQLIETDRSSLVAGYLGQTAIKTQKVIQEALGGVLFIDEAYSLAREDQDQYGQEAIETLLKAMEDHRDELVVIVAGYDELMHQFIESNPGLRSRFNKYFHFPDYTGDELEKIFESFCNKNGYMIHQECKEHLKENFDLMYQERKEHFGNARTVRNVFEHAIQIQANRLARLPLITKTDLMELTLEDVSEAIEEEK